jgi:hemolysin III
MSVSSSAVMPRYSFGDELASSIIHGIGIVLSIAGLATLVAFAALHGNALAVVACAVFGTSLILLYTASTLYHSIPAAGAKPALRALDHIAIYGLIAGSYTPFALVGLRDHGGAWLLAAVWTLALAGVVFKWFFTGRFKLVSTLLYLAMGWLALVVVKPMAAVLPLSTLLWLLAGGLADSLGTVFYLSKRQFAHAAWHGFVLAGSACHYVAVTQHLLGT